MTKLIPSRYLCRQHGRELTETVAELVDQDPGVVANLGYRASPEGRITIGTFKVDVSCPGEDTPHVLRFMGTFER